VEKLVYLFRERPSVYPETTRNRTTSECILRS